jgi:hypothetical protein
MKTELPIYIRIAEALKMLDDPGGSMDNPIVSGVMEVNDTKIALRDPLFESMINVANQLLRATIR